MSEKLKDYQVIDVGCGGAFYKVRHKLTNDIFTWKAYDCSAYSEEQIQNIVNEVKNLSKLNEGSLLKYYDTILHAPSKTLYFVLEFTSWRSLEELTASCKTSNRYVSEGFMWFLIHEIARACKVIEDLNFVILQKSITPSSIFIEDSGTLRINCFELTSESEYKSDLMRQLGNVIYKLCYDLESTEFFYSEDLKDVINFLLDDKNANLRPDVILYHPTVLANLESAAGLKRLSDVLVSADCAYRDPDVSCDSEKSLQICTAVEPVLPRRQFPDSSPTYMNISPKRILSVSDHDVRSPKCSLSPTLAALALELPGFVPRKSKLVNNAVSQYTDPQQVSERTLSNQWMSRLIALRKREETLNRRERELIAKEIVQSPNVKIIPLTDHSEEHVNSVESNGITLPPLPVQSMAVAALDDRNSWVSRRHHRRSSSVRTRNKRRKSYGYEDLDSSLSADAGDGSVIITSTKFTKENMPRNIFPEISTKKVHFTSANPFVESDESVTLTFYELESVDNEGYQLPRQKQYITRSVIDDIAKFKYLDLEKAALEKRAAMTQYTQSSPSKQAKFAIPEDRGKKVFADITNKGKTTNNAQSNMKKTPSKSSLTSRTSNTSNGTRYSTASSVKSHWSSESEKSKVSFESCVSDGVRSSTRLRQAHATHLTRQSMAPPETREEEVKKPKGRKSLLPFKTHFKFMTSSKS